MTRRSLVVALLALSVAVPVRAQDPIPPALLRALDPAAVRHEMALLAGRVAPGDSLIAAEAWDLAGLSYHRGGLADSAIVCWQNSLARHPNDDAMDALIEALFTRRGPGDVAAAREWIARRFQLIHFEAGEWDLANTQGRLGWALFLGGDADSARKVFTRARRLLDDGNPMRWIWRLRIATVAHANGDRDRALEMSKDLVVRSLMQDRDALQLLHDVLGGDQGDRRYAPFLRTELLHAHQLDEQRLTEARARRIRALGADGFSLSGIAFTPRGRARRAVIAIGNAEDDFAHYDSLASGLARAGYALVVMDPRGSGCALGNDCPSPESWNGREEMIEHAVAGDVRRMFTAAAREGRLDSTTYVVLGTAGSSVIAVEAAALDPRVRLLLLLSPLPPRVEIGRMAARLAKRRLPTFFETAPSDVGAAEAAAQLYESVDPKVSRLVDSEGTGRGPVVFRYDGTAMPRLTGWLAERFPAKAAPRPAARRKG